MHVIYQALRGQNWLARLMAAVLSFGVGWFIFRAAACQSFYLTVLGILAALAFVVAGIAIFRGQNAYYLQIIITVLVFLTPLALHAVVTPPIARTEWAQRNFCPVEACDRLAVAQELHEADDLKGAVLQARACIEETKAKGKCQRLCGDELARILADQASRLARDKDCDGAREKLAETQEVANRYQAPPSTHELIAEKAENLTLLCDVATPTPMVVTVEKEVIVTPTPVPPTPTPIPPTPTPIPPTPTPITPTPTPTWTLTPTPTPVTPPPITPSPGPVDVSFPGACNPGAYISNVLVTVQGSRTKLRFWGTVNLPSADYYRLDVGASAYPSDSEWQTIHDADAPVTNDQLGEWDITDVRGVWSIRLMVVKEDSNYEDLCKVVVNIHW